MLAAKFASSVANSPRDLAILALQCALGFIDAGEGAARLFQIAPAGVGQSYAARGPAQQLDTQPVFQARQRAAHHRGCGRQLDRRSCQRAALHNGDKGLHVDQVIESARHFVLKSRSYLNFRQFIFFEGINKVTALATTRRIRTMKKTLLAALIAWASLQAQAGNVLVVLSGAHALDLKDGKTFETGFYLNELMQPVKMLLDAGHHVTFATPDGNAPAIDRNSVNPMFFGGDALAMKVHMELMDTLGVTRKVASLDKIDSAKFDAVYVPGGHAPMQDLLTSEKLGKVLRSFHAGGKTTALVCHGPIALLSAMPDAKGFSMKHEHGQASAPAWTYAGYRVTAFSNVEEDMAKAQLNGGEMKFYPQFALEQAGLNFSSAAQPWQAHVVTDRELITGQNPASAPPLVGQELLKRLAAAH
jgi:putative intracellular protease/amidase